MTTTFETIKNNLLLSLLIIACVILSPILIPLFLIDDINEDNYYKRYL